MIYLNIIINNSGFTVIERETIIHMDNPIKLPDSVDNAIEKATDKPATKLGDIITDIMDLVFGRVELAAEKSRLKRAKELQLFRDELETKINEIPEENRIEPETRTVAQAMEASKYCLDSSEIRNLFENLITGSMNNSIKDGIHPSFSDAIKEMSSNDAILLKVFSHVNTLPVIDLGLKNGVQHIEFYYRNLVLGYNGLSSEEACLSVAVLARLGILDISTGIRNLSDLRHYEPFKELGVYKQLELRSFTENKELYVSKGIAELTSYGKAFCKVCIR